MISLHEAESEIPTTSTTPGISNALLDDVALRGCHQLLQLKKSYIHLLGSLVVTSSQIIFKLDQQATSQSERSFVLCGVDLGELEAENS